jgi:hypothetical protein
MKRLLIIWVFLLVCALGASLEADEIYQWIDEDGVQHFTDGPPPPGAQIVEGLTEAKPDAPQPQPGPAGGENTRAIEGDEGGAPGVEEPIAIEDDQNRPGDREEFWRRRGWDSGSTDGPSGGALPGGENAAIEEDTPGAGLDSEDGPPDGGENP